jgi:hypothetical protein
MRNYLNVVCGNILHSVPEITGCKNYLCAQVRVVTGPYNPCLSRPGDNRLQELFVPRPELSRVRTIPACPVLEITGCKDYLCQGQGCHKQQSANIICEFFGVVTGPVQSHFPFQRKKTKKSLLCDHVNAGNPSSRVSLKGTWQ